MEVEDYAFKSLDEVCAVDGRTAFALNSDKLEHWHKLVARIVLDDVVPIKVRRNFDRARNLSLYAWYVYEFHQVAELDAMAALEMALRIKAKSEGFEKVKGMRNLLDHARRHSWIRGADLHYMKICEEFYGREQSLNEGVNSGLETELSDAEKDKKRLDRFIEYIPGYRNDLAHGSGCLHEGSPNTLERCRDAINALFRP